MKVSKKMIFGQKTHFFPWWLWPIMANNDPPSGQMIIYRKTECIQSYLRIWGRYDPIESGLSDPKKWVLYRCSVKKSRFSGQKWALAASPGLAVERVNTKIMSFCYPVMMVSIFLENITNIDVDLIRQPEAPNWPTVPPPIPNKKVPPQLLKEDQSNVRV